MSGPPIVLVHGFATTSARTWGETGWLDLLADAGRTVHPLDLLGHGSSPTPHDPADYDLEHDLLARFPPEPVDAIGFSLGARTLLRIAAASPERFVRLVVAGVGAALFDPDPERGADILSAIEGHPDLENPQAVHFHQLASEPGTDRQALAACLARPSPPFTEEELGRVDVPVLVALGDRDFAGPADPLLAALPRAELVTLRNVDHFATPKSFEFIDAALGFLDARPF